MEDRKTTIKQLKEVLDEFMKKRDWKKFHNPKDLAIAISIEAGEILEHFKFKTNEEIRQYLDNKENTKELSYELADVLHFLFLLANVTDIDLAKASEEKLKISGKKYPEKLVKGKAHKYTYYQNKV